MTAFAYVVAIAFVVGGIFLGTSGVSKPFGEAVGRLFAGFCFIIVAAIIFVLASGIVRW